MRGSERAREAPGFPGSSLSHCVACQVGRRRSRSLRRECACLPAYLLPSLPTHALVSTYAAAATTPQQEDGRKEGRDTHARPSPRLSFPVPLCARREAGKAGREAKVASLSRERERERPSRADAGTRHPRTGKHSRSFLSDPISSLLCSPLKSSCTSWWSGNFRGNRWMKKSARSCNNKKKHKHQERQAKRDCNTESERQIERRDACLRSKERSSVSRTRDLPLTDCLLSSLASQAFPLSLCLDDRQDRLTAHARERGQTHGAGSRSAGAEGRLCGLVPGRLREGRGVAPLPQRERRGSGSPLFLSLSRQAERKCRLKTRD